MPNKYTQPPRENKNASASPNLPVKTFRLGRIKAAVWENEGEQKFYSVTFARTYVAPAILLTPLSVLKFPFSEVAPKCSLRVPGETTSSLKISQNERASDAALCHRPTLLPPQGARLTSTLHSVIIARIGSRASESASGFGLPPNAREGQKRCPTDEGSGHRRLGFWSSRSEEHHISFL
jgi:hypothetical protein